MPQLENRIKGTVSPRKTTFIKKQPALLGFHCQSKCPEVTAN